MAKIDVSEEAAELAVMFQGMSRADRDAVMQFARIRKAKYEAKTGSGAVVANLTVTTMHNSRGGLFDGFGSKI